MKPRAALLFSASALALAGCAEEATPATAEALAQSGKSAFVCLALDQPDPEKPGVMRSLPITDCSYRTVESSTDYEVDAENGGKATLPHLYGLVTQTARGEVAVVDMTTKSSLVVDRDPGTPGANFLPIGAQPVDIVATPGGTASFVAVAEPGRAGIFALPSAKVLPREGCPVPSLSSWPACSLPSAPGEMLLVADPPDPDPLGSGNLRSSCDDAAYNVEPTKPGDPSAFVDDVCATSNGSLAMEGGGRQKLLVSMPDLGGFAVIDAQGLLEGADYQDGGFAPCDVERWVPLQVSLPRAAAPGAPGAPGEAPHGPECAQPPAASSSEQAIEKPRPAGLALADDRLYIADLDAPVVHVVDLQKPCEPIELPPLLPASTLDPARVVTTTRLAVSPASPPDFSRYLYAVDAGDGSVMVFDVSDGASARSPLVRPHPEWNPFQPPDRIRLAAPVRDLAIVQREVPRSLPATGVVPQGIRCDPDPSLKACDSSVTSCDIETRYRTSADRDSGAGPLKLRGTFAYLVLTNGKFAIVDIDDLDAACRGPERESLRAGCAEDASPSDPSLETSGEASCNVVLPHAVRSASYVVASDGSGQIEPGVQGLPILYDRNGAVVQLSRESPKMRATFPSEGAAALSLAVGAQREPIASVDSADGELDEQGLILRPGGPQHALTMNLEDPRVHLSNETWTVTYEGVLASLTRTFVSFDEDHNLRGTDARFCRRGVQSLASVKAQLTAAGVPANEIDARAGQLADFAQITSELPDEDSSYWESVDPSVCSFDSCNAKYGSVVPSRPALRIVEAYEDHLELAPGDPEVGFAACCFAGSVQLGVRAGSQWVVRSNGAGFLHHVIADPETGACRNSCDARLSRLNGRVVHTQRDGRVTDGEPGAFLSPMFRFAVTGGVPEQDMQFRFTTQGAFTPILEDLSDKVELQPQAIRLVPATGELAVTDGSFQGLILLSSSDVAVARSFR
ncbi:hypothetical protein [Sorangium sp. So ce1000]|uniref:hypothetical protein n=1 Tax=Sorangium sp. So ce1000 TaxID=3133325 RepID=UPI003F646DEE